MNNKTYILFISLFYLTNINAQYVNTNQLHDYFGLYVPANADSTLEKPFYNYKQQCTKVTFNDSSGKVICITDGDVFYDNAGKILFKSPKSYFSEPYHRFVTYSYLMVIRSSVRKNAFYLIGQKSYYPSFNVDEKIRCRYIEFNNDLTSIKVDTPVSYLDANPRSLLLNISSMNDNGSYWILTYSNNCIVLNNFYEGKIIKKIIRSHPQLNNHLGVIMSEDKKIIYATNTDGVSVCKYNFDPENGILDTQSYFVFKDTSLFNNKRSGICAIYQIPNTQKLILIYDFIKQEYCKENIPKVKGDYIFMRQVNPINSKLEKSLFFELRNNYIIGSSNTRSLSEIYLLPNGDISLRLAEGSTPYRTIIRTKSDTIYRIFPYVKVNRYPEHIKPYSKISDYWDYLRINFPLDTIFINFNNLSSFTGFNPKHSTQFPRFDMGVRQGLCDSTMEFYVEGDTSYWKSAEFIFTDGVVLKGKQTKRKFKVGGNHWVGLRVTNADGLQLYKGDSAWVDPVKLKPIASFTASSQEGCQYLDFHFLNESKWNPKIPTTLQIHYGDGKDSSFAITKNVQKTTYRYQKDGSYIATFILENGFCKDTSQLQVPVKIQPAPYPNFKLYAERLCSPIEVKAVFDKMDSVVQVQWFHNGILHSNAFNKQPPSVNVIKRGTHKVKAILRGPTGCITQDSQRIELKSGFEGKESIRPLEALYQDANFKVYWDSLPLIQKYEVRTNNGAILYANNRSITISREESQVPKFFIQIIGIDSCEQRTPISTIYPVQLSGYIAEENEYVTLNWIDSNKWGTKPSTILREVNGYWPLTPMANGINTWKSSIATSALNYNKAFNYVIEIKDSAGRMIRNSEILTLRLHPLVYIPNAFSPGNDKLNEVFEVFATGVESTEMKIYNRWGQRIYSGKNIGWNGKDEYGKDCEAGIYAYEIRVLIDKEWKIYRGTVQIIQ